MTQRFFVTGTDTGVGKTQVSAALLQLMAARELRPFAFKPYESGGSLEASDSVRLQRAAGGHQPLSTVCCYRFNAPLAPMMAARLERKRTSWARVLRTFASFEGAGVVEGAGGVQVPLDARHDVIDLIAALGAPVVLVARAGLGTVNHTSLTLQALERRGLEVAALVLMQATRSPDHSVKYNRAELTRRFPGLPIAGPIPYLPAPERLARELRARLSALRPFNALR